MPHARDKYVEAFDPYQSEKTRATISENYGETYANSLKCAANWIGTEQNRTGRTQQQITLPAGIPSTPTPTKQPQGSLRYLIALPNHLCNHPKAKFFRDTWIRVPLVGGSLLLLAGSRRARPLFSLILCGCWISA